MSSAIRSDRIVPFAAVGVFGAALLVLIVTGHTSLRHSGDTPDTTPMLLLWVPALVGIVLTRLVPPKVTPDTALPDTDPNTAARQGWLLAGTAVAFVVALHLAPRTPLWFIGLKFGLLLAIPLLLRQVTVREWLRLDTRGRWLRPLPAAVGFALACNLVVQWDGATAPSALTLAALLLINATTEEIFYRLWLQTRLEARYGRWPAIAVTALLFGAWHSAVQGGAGTAIDLASAVLNTGVTGLFLGYFWSRYRNPWLLILAHEAANTPVAMLAAMA
ncbi:CPBP family intramembrane metalloprotease [Nocardia sp. CDC159]|uniref:CPBP family intramembrane metalloprotease n=1 Tax=Nocardia pulmonis TaxID=2951408 RepID=A0A9X2IZJ3_9NOCA|nr:MULTISPECIES: CPBP family intramembrane glutamic endopeptidase [Nocardia]MCM6776814.1 CPBP family intramembrane metalloprotease [Nocardia pulmonis]MCM6789037.1 CPBP family intramembrane metalloprotease [Nocardia sp. CDC159]